MLWKSPSRRRSSRCALVAAACLDGRRPASSSPSRSFPKPDGRAYNFSPWPKEVRQVDEAPEIVAVSAAREVTDRARAIEIAS